MIYYFSEINNKYNFIGGFDMRFREVEKHVESVERLSEKKPNRNLSRLSQKQE